MSFTLRFERFERGHMEYVKDFRLPEGTTLLGRETDLVNSGRQIPYLITGVAREPGEINGAVLFNDARISEVHGYLHNAETDVQYIDNNSTNGTLLRRGDNVFRFEGGVWTPLEHEDQILFLNLGGNNYQFSAALIDTARMNATKFEW